MVFSHAETIIRLLAAKWIPFEDDLEEDHPVQSVSARCSTTQPINGLSGLCNTWLVRANNLTLIAARSDWNRSVSESVGQFSVLQKKNGRRREEPANGVHS